MQNSSNKPIKIINTSGGFALFVCYMSLDAAKSFYLLTLKYFRRVFCFVCLLIFSAIGNASEQKEFQFDIPQQSLAKSLNALSNHTKTLVLFPYDLVEKRQGNAVKGQFTLVQAIDKLLLHTGLDGSLSKKEVMMISEQQTLLLKNTHKNIHNNNRNKKMKTKKSILATTLAFLFSGTTVSGSALAQDAAQQSQDDQAEVISILGTRGAPRTVTDSPVAIVCFLEKNSQQMVTLLILRII
jgi:hypothetical protein